MALVLPREVSNLIEQPLYPGTYISGLSGIANAWSPHYEALTVDGLGRQAIRPRVGGALMSSTGEAPWTFPTITRNSKTRRPSYTPNTGTQEWSAPVTITPGWNSVIVFGEHATFNHEIFRLWLTAEHSLVGNPWAAGGATGCMLRHHNQTSAVFTDLLGIPNIPANTLFWWICSFNTTTGQVRSRSSLATSAATATNALMAFTPTGGTTNLLFGRMRNGRHYDGYPLDIFFANADLVDDAVNNIRAYGNALYGMAL